jgi:hypothetical protein
MTTYFFEHHDQLNNPQQILRDHEIIFHYIQMILYCLYVLIFQLSYYLTLKTLNSTRRFCCLPSSVSLVSIG